MAALRNRKMGNFLNLVYDEWDYNNPKSIINGKKYFGNDFRHMDSIILKRIGFHNFLCHSIKDVNNFSSNENYYYVISNTAGLETKLNSDFELPLSKEVIECAKQKNFNIIFFNYVEVESRNSLYLTESKIKSLGINPNQVWVISNSSNIYKYKYELNLDMNVFRNKVITIDTVIDLRNNAGEIEFKCEKESFFMCQNNMPRPHRYGIIASLMKNNILQDTDWSIIEGILPDENYYSAVLSQEDIKNLSKEISYLKNIKTKKCNFEIDFNKTNIKPWNKAFEKRTFLNAYVNIINDTLFATEDIHITEKTFNPFYFYQYPLIVSSPYHIKNLKEEQSFDLFEDMINIEYDNEPDHVKRFAMIIEEIKRIYKNKQFFIDSYSKNYDRFLSNHKKVLEMENNKEDFNFFSNLSKLKHRNE